LFTLPLEERDSVPASAMKEEGDEKGGGEREI